MAIFGVGAYWDSDKTSDFIRHNVAVIGWDEKDAPGLHQIMRHMKVGDIVYLKSSSVGKKRLIVKAIGIILDDEILETADLQPLTDGNLGRNVGFIWEGNEDFPIPDDKEPLKNFTVYEEHNIGIQSRILELIFANCHFGHKGALMALEKLTHNIRSTACDKEVEEPF